MAPILTLEKISKRFGAVVVANGIDLTLGQGEALGIIGPNGAGKTTLFGMITGTITPDVSPDARMRTGLDSRKKGGGAVSGQSPWNRASSARVIHLCREIARRLRLFRADKQERQDADGHGEVHADRSGGRQRRE